jgi:hypothetical protein
MLLGVENTAALPELTPQLPLHVAACERCRIHVARIKAARSAAAGSHVLPAWALQLAAQPSRAATGEGEAPRFFGLDLSGFHRSVTVTALGVAVAFCGWLWLGAHSPSSSPSSTASSAAPGSEAEPYVAAKGEPGVAVYVMREGRVFSWNGSESVRPGDRLRLGVAPGRYRHVAVYTRAGGNVVTLYRGEVSGATDLPAAWTVDGQGEVEQMVVVLSAAPLADAELAERDRRRTFSSDSWARELTLPKQQGTQP